MKFSTLTRFRFWFIFANIMMFAIWIVGWVTVAYGVFHDVLELSKTLSFIIAVVMIPWILSNMNSAMDRANLARRQLKIEKEMEECKKYTGPYDMDKRQN